MQNRERRMTDENAMAYALFFTVEIQSVQYFELQNSHVTKCFKEVSPCSQLGKSFYPVPRYGLFKCLILLRSPLYFKQLHRTLTDTMQELSIIEAPSRSMPERSPFSLTTHFYLIESWFTPVHCRPLVLTLLIFSLVLCFAACLKSSTKEREI